MNDLFPFLGKITLAVLAAIAAIAYLSGGSGLSVSLAAEMFWRAVPVIPIVGSAAWRLLGERTGAHAQAVLLPTVAGMVWVIIWPWLDVWGQAAATVPSVLSYTGSVTDDAKLPWYATGIGQWGGLMVCAVAAWGGWAWGRD